MKERRERNFRILEFRENKFDIVGDIHGCYDELMELIEKLGYEKLVVFGDGKNDVDMFELADESYAVENAHEELKKYASEDVYVIGGDSIYKQMLPYCDTAYVTKVHVAPESDTYFPNLDADPDWTLEAVLQSGEEDGIAYEMCVYKRKGTT